MIKFKRQIKYFINQKILIAIKGSFSNANYWRWNVKY